MEGWEFRGGEGGEEDGEDDDNDADFDDEREIRFWTLN